LRAGIRDSGFTSVKQFNIRNIFQCKSSILYHLNSISIKSFTVLFHLAIVPSLTNCTV
jgi:hypothetical protein